MLRKEIQRLGAHEHVLKLDAFGWSRGGPSCTGCKEKIISHRSSQKHNATY